MTPQKDKPNWWDELEEMADSVLGQQPGSACNQIHPIIKAWYDETLNDDIPESRDAVLQAMACLTSEIMADMPEPIFQVLSENIEEESVALWLQKVLMVGRLFERGLESGRLDDL